MVNLAVMKPADVLAQLSKSDTLLWEISERIWEKQARRRHGAHLFKFEEWSVIFSAWGEWHYLGYLHVNPLSSCHSWSSLIISYECPHFFPWRICKVAGQVWYMAIRLWWGSVARRSFDRRGHWGVGYATSSKYVIHLVHGLFLLCLINLFAKNKKDKKVVFVTNNATKSRRSYRSKFDQLGVQAHVVSGSKPCCCLAL